jgi:uncharacterized iron-regulated protein
MSHFQAFLLCLLVSWSPMQVWAQIYNGRTLEKASLTQLASVVTSGSILILGEYHGLAAHRDQHVLILNQLREKGLRVSVGLEFINYTDQSYVSQYQSGDLDDDQFLSLINWTGVSFDFYKQQLKFPELRLGEFSLGLNLPRAITSKISKQGFASLTEDEKALLPPHFEVGRDSYKDRFREAAGAHCPNFENCFAAQSSWDDTMAWQAVNFIQNHPEQVLVIVVGEFHAQFGGGLADRIYSRFPEASVKIVSQIWAEDMTEDEVQHELQPSPVEGPRADFIWVSKPESK